MKQLKLLFTVLFLAVLGLGNVWATEVVYKTALFGSTYNSKGVSAYNASWTATNNGFTVNLVNWNNNNNGWDYIKAGNKNTAYVGTITTAAAIDKKVTKVVVKIDAITATNVNSIKLYTGVSEDACTTEIGSFDKSTGEKGLTLTSPTTNLFYKVSFDCIAKANGCVQVSKVEYYYDDAEDAPADCSTPTITFAEESVAKLTTDAAFTNAASVEYESTATGQTVSWSVEAGKEGVATVNATTGEVSIVGAGEAKIYASVAADGDYCEKSAYYTLTVTAPVVPTGTFTKYVGATLVEGDYLVCVGTDAMKNSVTSNRLDYASVTVTDNAVENPDAAVIWHIAPAATAGYVTMYNAAVEKYAASTGTKNQAGLLEDGTADKSLWSVSMPTIESYNFENKNNKANSVNACLQKNGTYGFACYATYSNITLYAKLGSYAISKASCTNGTVDVTGVADLSQVTAGTTVTLTNTPADGYKLAEYDVYKTGDAATKVTVTDGKFTMPAYDVTVSATFEVAKVLDGTVLTLGGEYPTEFWKGDAFSHDGLTASALFNTGSADVTDDVTFSGYDMATAGTQTVTVTYTEGLASQTATYEITIKTIANTKETAYTATEAIALVDAGKDLSTLVYVKGTVTSASAIGSYGNSNIFVTDGAASFEFYRCLDLNNVNFTSDYLKAEDKVVAYGEMTKYNSTYEFKAGCYLVDYTSGGGSTPTYASLAELVAAGTPTSTGTLVKVTLTDEVITEIVTKGVMLLSGSQEVEIFANEAVPAEWVKGGTISAEIECTWKLYNSTWELCPTGWSEINYTAPTTYTITCATDLEHGTVSADATDAAAGVEVTLSETHDAGYQLEAYSVVDAESNPVAVVGGKFTMPASNVTVSATFVEKVLPVWATTYTSNVTLTTTGGTNATASKVKVNGEETTYDAIKAGTGSNDGKIKVTLPLGTTKLHFHAVTWSGSATTATLSVKKDGDASELFGNVIRPNTGLSGGSTTYTLVGDPTEDYYSINFGSALPEATTFVFDASVDRFAIYGVNVEKDDIELLSIAISGTATKTEYFAGDVFDPAGLVVTGTYSVGEPQEITEGIDWTFTPATLAVGTTSVSAVATVGEISSEAFVVNDLTVAAAPLHADWVANAQGYADATAVVGSAIKHETTTVATVTFNKAEGSNDPKYYDNGEAVRAYAKNTIVVSALKGFTMKKIVPSFGTGDGSNAITASVGTYADGEWNGEATEVTFTIGGSTGNRRIAGITVYYEGELATPTGIVLNTETVKKEFAFGETFNSDNLVVKAVYSDESEEDVTLAAEVVAPNMETAGEKTVTVNYLTFSETYSITVAGPTEAESIELDQTSITVREDKTAKLTATVLPAEAVDKAVTWSSSDEDVVTVDENGNLTPVAVGNATITVKMTNNAAVYAECAVEITAAPIAKNYYLVKDASLLKDGDVIILGSANNNAVAGALGGNKYLASEEASFNEGVCTATEAIEFTLGKDGDNNWTLTSTEGVLGATAAKALSATTGTTTWTITISAEGVATIASTNSDYGTIQCNATKGQERFLNYASTMKAIEIYCTEIKKPVYTRETSVGKIGTICLPYEILPEDRKGASFYEIAYKVAADDYSMIFFDEIAEDAVLEAGKPYVYVAEASVIELAHGEETASAPVAGKNGLTGTFTAIEDGDAGTVGNVLEGNYVFYNNKYWRCEGNCSLAANRAYINKSEVNATVGSDPAPVAGRRRIAMGSNSTNTPTGLEFLFEVTDEAQKVMLNGQMYIIRNGRMFNALGGLVK